MKMEKKINKVVLAYSGGLDTSAMLLWIKEKRLNSTNFSSAAPVNLPPHKLFD